MPGRIPFPNPFEPLTVEKAWVLGLWFADGCVVKHDYSIQCLLYQKNDFDLLRHVAKILRLASDPRRVKLLTNPDRVCVSSGDFADQLLALGITPRKSLTMLWPTWVTEELLPHFVRGLIDGDGSI